MAMQNAAVAQAGASAPDLKTLQQLNGNYVKSAEMSDVRWYSENLAEDFLSSSVDGSLVDRAGFLARVARPHPGSDLRAEDVRIRILGEIAIIHGRTVYRKPDGRTGAGHYTDVGARRQGRWLCVSAEVTRG